MAANGKSNFGAQIDRGLHDEFKSHLPIYGATQYFIEHSVRYFNERMREDPALREAIRGSVESWLQENRARSQTETE